MSVSTKLWGGFIATVLLGGVLFHQLSVVRELADANARLATISSRVSIVGTEQLYRLDQLQESAAKYAVTEDARYADQFVEIADQVRSAFGDLDTLSLSAGERRHADRIRDLLLRLDDLTGDLAGLNDAEAASSPDSGVAATGAASIDSLREETLALTEASRSAMLEVADRSVAHARLAERRVWLIALLALSVAAFMTLFAARSVSRGLRTLAAGTRRVAEGDFDYRLSSAREREFRRLEADFNVMIERLSELERMKKNFLAGISHDLKSPLASIRETLSVLLDEVPGPLLERQRRLLQLAGKSGERLGGMISNLLDLAQLEADAIEYDVERQDLAALVREVAEEMETRFEEKGVDVELELAASLEADVDAGRMAQVIQNLLENALAVAPRASTIEVAARPLADGVGSEGSTVAGIRVEVRDRGPGVPEPLRDSIFDRFVQGDGAGGAGVGLGLTICREIIQAHGGRIRVEGREGGGSLFAFEIPARRPDTADGPEVRPPGPSVEVLT